MMMGKSLVSRLSIILGGIMNSPKLRENLRLLHPLLTPVFGLLMVAVSLVMLLMLVTPVLAQDGTEGATAAAIDEIIVSARKRDENIQNVPISMSAFSGDDIDRLSIRDISGTADFIPNVAFLEGGPGAGGSSLIYIRGISGAGIDSSRVDPGVGVYIDGVYLPRAQGGIRDLLDLERLEVLRGPQGTLFGKNTIGGAIHLITKKPSDEFYGDGRITIGNYNALETKLKVNVPLSDNFFTSLAVISSEHDGYSLSLANGEEASDKDRQSAWLAERHVHTQEPCSSCWARYLCGGGCHHEVIHRGRPACDYIRGWLHYCLQAYVRLLERRPDFFGNAPITALDVSAANGARTEVKNAGA